MVRGKPTYEKYLYIVYVWIKCEQTNNDWSYWDKCFLTSKRAVEDYINNPYNSISQQEFRRYRIVKYCKTNLSKYVLKNIKGGKKNEKSAKI